MPLGKIAARTLQRTPVLVTPKWVAESLPKSPKIVPVDATWYLQPSYDAADLNADGTAVWDARACRWTAVPPRRNAEREFASQRLPGARFFDIDAVADRETALPHMLPSVESFAAHMRRLAIARDDHVVVYDRQGFFSAPRAYWTFRVFGHSRVSLLDGGLPRWLREGRPTETGSVEKRAETAYEVDEWCPELVLDYDTVLANVSDFDAPQRRQMVDARPADRFFGAAPEPRPGLRAGHMPGAANVPFSALVDPAAQALRPVEELRELFAASGVSSVETAPLGFTCGSGITACGLFVAAELCGAQRAAVYDGSWAEYGSRRESLVRDDSGGSFPTRVR